MGWAIKSFFISFLVLLCLNCNILAQSKIDSLKSVLEIHKPDTSKVNTYNLLIKYLARYQDSACIEVANKSIALSKQIDFPKGIADANLWLGTYFRYKSEYDKALINFSNAEKYYSKHNDLIGMAAIHIEKGVIGVHKAEYQKAVNHFEEALHLYEELKMENEIANSLLNLGITYSNLGLLSKSLQYYLECLRLDEKLGNRAGVAEGYNYIAIIFKKQKDMPNSQLYVNKAIEEYLKLDDLDGLGSAYMTRGINYKEINQTDSAIIDHQNALECFEKTDNTHGKLAVYHNLGTAYLKAGEYKSALLNLKKSLAGGKMYNSPLIVLVNQNGIAETLYKMGSYDSALYYASNGMKMAKDTESLEELSNSYKLISDIYKAKKQYNLAMTFLEHYLVTKDSIFNIEKSKQAKELQAVYETEKKEQQITLLQKEKDLQFSYLNQSKLEQRLLAGSILLIAVISLSIFVTYRTKQKNKRNLLDEQLRQEKLEAERLKELDLLKSRFFSNIAHEFRTPLTLILGPLENLLETVKSMQVKSQLQLIKTNSTRLLRLINQLLDLSKLESGMMKLNIVQDDIISFVKGLVFSFQSMADQKKIHLEVHTRDENFPVWFDKDKLEKIIINLLSNAFKFTPSEGYVRVNLFTTDSSFLQIDVQDTGLGIPQEHIDKIFDRFYQSDNARLKELEGSGIGLALTKELVEVLGGKIWVASHIGQGSTFSFTLPLKQVFTGKDADTEKKSFIKESNSYRDVELENKEFSFSPNDIENSLKKDIILVIEDNADVRKFIVDSIKATYHIMEADSGRKGLELAREKLPDLVISDVMMPEMDGLETCRHLKTDERTSHIPVILLTAKAGVEDRIKGLELGADDYLPKPFHPRELLTRIGNLITLRKKLQEKYLAGITGSQEEQHIIPEQENQFLSNLKRVVEENLADEAFSIEDLARGVAMSRTQIHRKLKALTNQNASLFMRTIRLHHAKQLLEKGVYNVSEVAYRVGFSSPTYFSTCFSELYGFAPSELLEKHKQI